MLFWINRVTHVDFFCCCGKQVSTYGSFMRMNTLAMKKLRSTLTKPMKSNRKRLSLGMFGALERSRIMKPRPPIVKRKLEASPSIMYWPFTLENKQTCISYALLVQLVATLSLLWFSSSVARCKMFRTAIPVCQKGNWPLVSMLISHWTHTWWFNYDVVDDSCSVDRKSLIIDQSDHKTTSSLSSV